MNNIVYEDNHLIVLEKPRNVLVQSDNTNDLDLLTMVKKFLKEKYNKPGNVYLGLVHRLDRPVGGIMVFAKTSKAASRLSDMIRTHNFKKTYYAVVCGNILSDEVFEDYLKKIEANNTTIVDESGKYAKLTYNVVKRVNDLSLVKINLETGRSHQIRVQFSSRGFPLWGDQRYNSLAKPGQQIALWAYSISFAHPVTKNILEFSLNPYINEYPWSLFGSVFGE